jgi:hypothetical protein
MLSDRDVEELPAERGSGVASEGGWAASGS